MGPVRPPRRDPAISRRTKKARAGDPARAEAQPAVFLRRFLRTFLRVAFLRVAFLRVAFLRRVFLRRVAFLVVAFLRLAFLRFRTAILSHPPFSAD